MMLTETQRRDYITAQLLKSRYPICSYCDRQVINDKPVKIWSQLKSGEFYHDFCLKEALIKAKTYDVVYRTILDYPQDRPMRCHVVDIWVCNDCGGRSLGYSLGKCRHCGAKEIQGNGYYERGTH